MNSLVAVQFAVLCQLSYIAGGSIVKQEEIPLKLTVCYESYCPDCVLYDSEQVAKAWDRFKDRLHLFLVPYGNSEQKYVKGHWQFTCQHGPKECLANKLHVCAIDQACPSGQGTFECAVDDVTRVLGYTRCVMKHLDQLQATNKCAKAEKLDPDSIIECAKSKKGETLLSQYGNFTDSLFPQHQYVPWVLLDERHNQKAETNLMAEICLARPSWCSSSPRSKLEGPQVEMI